MRQFINKVLILLNVFCTNAKRFLKDHVEPTVAFLNIVKTAIDSPIASAITSLTPTQLDDIALARARQWLPMAISVLDLPIKAIEESETFEEKLNLFIDYLRGQPKEIQSAILSKTATVMSKLKANGTHLKESEIDLLVHLAVQKLKHGNK